MTVRWVSQPRPEAKYDHEVGNAFAVQNSLATEVAKAIQDGDFAVILGGNCSSILGAVAGSPSQMGLVFFDAHADANTPETSASGFLDGMPVAVATGRCWRPLAKRIPGFAPLPDSQVVLVGQRSIDAEEQRLLDDSAIRVITAQTLASDEGHLVTALHKLAKQVQRVHVHVDLDVIDTADGLANEQWAREPGPSLEQLIGAIRTIPTCVSVGSVSLTSYNPKVDTDGRALTSGLAILQALTRTAFPQA